MEGTLLISKEVCSENRVNEALEKLLKCAGLNQGANLRCIQHYCTKVRKYVRNEINVKLTQSR